MPRGTPCAVSGGAAPPGSGGAGRRSVKAAGVDTIIVAEILRAAPAEDCRSLSCPTAARMRITEILKDDKRQGLAPGESDATIPPGLMRIVGSPPVNMNAWAHRQDDLRAGQRYLLLYAGLRQFVSLIDPQ